MTSVRHAADNRDTYYLRDGMGGHTGLLTDDDDNPATAQQFTFSTYDAFGNHMSPGRPPSQAGSFAWRGAEGSVYDAHPTLVYMQARHYDPTIGRFIQPDSLAIGSMTTQGMNRYLYCENDPVNFSDPAGTFGFPLFAIFLLIAIAVLLIEPFLGMILKMAGKCALKQMIGFDPFSAFFGLLLIVLGLGMSAIPGGFLFAWIPALIGFGFLWWSGLLDYNPPLGSQPRQAWQDSFEDFLSVFFEDYIEQKWSHRPMERLQFECRLI